MLLFYACAPVLLCWQSLVNGAEGDPNLKLSESEGSSPDYDDYLSLLNKEYEYLDQQKEKLNDYLPPVFDWISEAKTDLTEALGGITTEIDEILNIGVENVGKSLEGLIDQDESLDTGENGQEKCLETGTDGSSHDLRPEMLNDKGDYDDEYERTSRALEYEYYVPYYYPVYPYYPRTYTPITYYPEVVPLAVPAQGVSGECLVPVQQVIPVKGEVTIARTFTGGCFNLQDVCPVDIIDDLVSVTACGDGNDDNGCDGNVPISAVTPVSGQFTVTATYGDGVINFPALSSEVSEPPCCDGSGPEDSVVAPVTGQVTISAAFDECGAMCLQSPEVPVSSIVTKDQNIAVVPSIEVRGKVPAHGQVTITTQF
ncbi:uncharacterized protein LOC126378461 isoform X1 [Pectinophora gossypiella]|uniref:uncharacterized protein LOC126378461 isoform X1 n=1 Tax=Pectinophora gossypiella TaxID=13191 RepID=UPI00214EC4B4|nr:uncharacterized protein LOC126378461 isoform X1 [Pectinophora gossypiella]